jgi:hypothetical protein
MLLLVTFVHMQPKTIRKRKKKNLEIKGNKNMCFSALMSHLEPTRVQLSPLEMPLHISSGYNNSFTLQIKSHHSYGRGGIKTK